MRNKQKTAISSSLILIELLFLFLSILFFCLRVNAREAGLGLSVNCVSGIVCLAFLLILTAGILFDRTPMGEGMLCLLSLILLTALALLATVLFWCAEGRPGHRLAIHIFRYVQYLAIPALVLEYWLYAVSYLDLSSRNVDFLTELLKLLCLLDILFILSNAFLGHLFVLDENACLVSGRLRGLTLIYPILGFLSVIIVMGMQDLSLRQGAAFIVCVFLPVLAALLSFRREASCLPFLSSVMSITLLYLTLFIDRGRELILSQAALSRQKMSVMASQIQPHFLYNALTAIMSIPGNPPETKEALSDFSSYLRGNLNVLKQSSPIPFSEELNHIRHYLHLEKLRFEEDLRIEYDIRTESFFVPALSVQMLAENAVKHGITAKEDGGTLFIGTDETEEEFIVTVKDDGVGFTQEALDGKKADDGRIHIGLENIDNRLRDMVGGTMEIRSQRGKGTEITLRLPKNGQPSGN